jgi:thiamine pyrophosphokinase
LRCVIFANGKLNHFPALQPDDLIIAADGGARHCLRLGLRPAIVIGDLDSLDEADLDKLRANGAKIVQYSARKDYTDLELALRHAQELGSSEILVLGALGERWDQTVANLLLPAALAQTPTRLEDGNQEIHFLRGGETLTLHGQPGDTLSLIPLAGDARGVFTQNLEYPLDQEDLIFGSTRGVSNVLLADQAAISLREGLLCCILSHVQVEI